MVYDVCPNDCVIFRGLYEDMSECPKCGSGRYIGSSKIACRIFTYLPLKPRLARLFNTSNMAQVLQSHATFSECDENLMYDMHQSTAWNDAYSIGGLFGGDRRGICSVFVVVCM